jgi:hypothetical protein
MSTSKEALVLGRFRRVTNISGVQTNSSRMRTRETEGGVAEGAQEAGARREGVSSVCRGGMVNQSNPISQ